MYIIKEITMDDEFPILPFAPPEEVKRANRKRYYQENKDKINERRRAKYAQKHTPKQHSEHTVKSLQATAKNAGL